MVLKQSGFAGTYKKKNYYLSVRKLSFLLVSNKKRSVNTKCYCVWKSCTILIGGLRGPYFTDLTRTSRELIWSICISNEISHNENCFPCKCKPSAGVYSAQFWLEDLACFQNSYQITLCYVPVKSVSMFVWNSYHFENKLLYIKGSKRVSKCFIMLHLTLQSIVREQISGFFFAFSLNH